MVGTSAQKQLNKKRLMMAREAKARAKKLQTWEGRRIYSYASLGELILSISNHHISCKSFKLNLGKEKRRGLFSEAVVDCACGWAATLLSDGDNTTLPIHEAFVWATFQAPLGYDAARAFMTVLDIPSPSRTYYNDVRNSVKDDIQIACDLNLYDCMMEEIDLAEKENRYAVVDVKEDGINAKAKRPCVRNKLDGSWAIRCYGHSYDSNCGAAVVVGAHFKKVIDYGWRIKTCHVCKVAENKGEDAQVHQCYKNWDGPSTAMEADIIHQIFKESLPKYGCVFDIFIGDGDSSVYAKVKDVYGGIEVKKVECSNHLMKNLNKKLYAVGRNQAPNGKSLNIPTAERQLPGMQATFTRLGLCVRAAAVYHNQNSPQATAGALLKRDILNAPLHVFGQHDGCHEYFCSKEKHAGQKNFVPEYSKLVFWGHMMDAVNFIAERADSLVQLQNTNEVECVMSVINKYMEGKRKNYGQSYMYIVRLQCALMSYNIGTFWAAKAIELSRGIEPTKLWQNEYRLSCVVRNRPKRKRAPRPVNFGFCKSGGDIHYGDNPQTPDWPLEKLLPAVEALKLKLQLDEEHRFQLATSTVEQTESPLWLEERRPRITASVAGQIYKLREKSDNTNVLKLALGLQSVDTVATRYGKATEKCAIFEYENHCNLDPGSVLQSGLIVSEENGIFAVSPDGLVGDDGLVEIKCPYSIRDESPFDWPMISKFSPLTNEDGNVILKRNHNYFYQCLMQLYVTGRKWVDFVVYTEVGIFVERIETSDENLEIWNNMKFKLEQFWTEELAPELVNSRLERGYCDFRCPPARKAARDKKAKAKQDRLAKKLNLSESDADDNELLLEPLYVNVGPIDDEQSFSVSGVDDNQVLLEPLYFNAGAEDADSSSAVLMDM